jgi:hypothetical protein
MFQSEEHRDKGELGDLRPLVEAIRSEVPSDDQWNKAREQLLGAISALGEPDQTAKNPHPLPLSPRERGDSRSCRRRSWIAWLTVTAAACLLVAAIGISRRSLTPKVIEAEPVARAEMVEGPCSRITAANESGPLAPGTALAAGDRIVVGRDAQVGLRTADGSRMWLYPGTEAVCTGPRSSTKPALRLLRGEVLAQIVRSSKESFGIDTPLAALRVLGTEFYMRVLPGLGQEFSTKERVVQRSSSVSFSGAIMVLTVLSGTVALEAAGQENVVREGHQAIVSGGRGVTSTEKVENLDYIKNWLSKRLRTSEDHFFEEMIVPVPVRPGMLQSLLAYHPQSGKWRHVTDILSASEVPELWRLGPNVSLLRSDSPATYFTHRYPPGGPENPLGNREGFLVDVRNGETVLFQSLSRFDSPSQFAISPDGRQVKFEGYPLGQSPPQRGLYVLNLETLKTAAKPSVLEKNEEGGPRVLLLLCNSWSPDSRWLAGSEYVPGEDHSAGDSLVLWDTLTGEIRKAKWKGMNPLFAPDGKCLVFGGEVHQEQKSDAESRQLFIAELPDGKPRQLTHLKGKAVESWSFFSPDGTRLFYWSCPEKKCYHIGEKTLHSIDLHSGRDQEILATRAGFGTYFRDNQVHWIDGRSQFILQLWNPDADSAEDSIIWQLICEGCEYKERPKSQPAEEEARKFFVLKQVDLRGEKPAVRDLEVPGEFCRQTPQARAITDQLIEAFTSYRKAARAEQLHQLEDAQAKYGRARDLLNGVLAALKVPEKMGGLKLMPDNLRRFRDLMVHEASLDKKERTIRLVREVLGETLPQMLEWYFDRGFHEGDWKKNVEGPPTNRLDFEACVKGAVGKFWNVPYGKLDLWGQLPCNADRIRHLFVMPGVDPNKVSTSWEVVKSDDGDGVLILRTPVLPNGKRLEATYRAERTVKTPQGQWHHHVVADLRELE